MSRALDARLESLFLRLDALPLPQALLALAATCIALNVAFALLLGWPARSLGLDPRAPAMGEAIVRMGPAKAFALVVLLMPFLETLLFQAFALLVSRQWTGRPTATIAFSAMVFAASHAVLSHLSHGLTQLAGGAMLALTFFWASRRPPRPRPILATWIVHALNNLAVVAFLFAAA